MDHKNDLSTDDAVRMLLEKLKSNGTFDEFQRQCISEIDQPIFQNWKQLIESNVFKFLSNINYTPELNKNTIRGRLRKHLLDGRETQDIEEEIERILNQVLVPRYLRSIEGEISIAVNDYLGIKNDTPPVELNGLILDTENVEEVPSPDYEPLPFLQSDSSNDSISGFSDLNSVGSPISIVLNESHDAEENELIFQNNPNQTKYNDNVNENLNLTISKTVESTSSVCENSISNVNIEILSHNVKYEDCLPLKNYKPSNNNIFEGFSELDITFPLDFIKKLIETTQEEINNQNSTIYDGFKGFTDDDGFKGFTDDGFKGFTDDDDLELCINWDKIHSQLKLIKSLGFPGFFDNDKILYNGYKYIKGQLDLAKKQNEIDNQQKNIASGNNGIQNGTTFNEVMAITYNSNNDNDKTSVAVYSQPNRDIKKECPVVNNNNHDITGSENWMARQEIKYKLIPVKVMLERLVVRACGTTNDSKPLSSPP